MPPVESGPIEDEDKFVILRVPPGLLTRVALLRFTETDRLADSRKVIVLTLNVRR